jgi:hypothetical protein
MSEKEMSIEELEKAMADLFIPHMIFVAKDGCKHSARELINTAVHHLERGYDLPDTLKPYLLEAFKAILRGESADRALNLSFSRGKNESRYYQKLSIAHEVHRLLKTKGANTVDVACEIVAKRKGICINAETARKYYYQLRKNWR